MRMLCSIRKRLAKPVSIMGSSPISLKIRYQKRKKRGRTRLFNPDVYKHRFGIERTFAWIDNPNAYLFDLIETMTTLEDIVWHLP